MKQFILIMFIGIIGLQAQARSRAERIEKCAELEVKFHYFAWNNPSQIDWMTWNSDGVPYICEDHGFEADEYEMQKNLCFDWWNFECENETFFQ